MLTKKYTERKHGHTVYCMTVVMYQNEFMYHFTAKACNSMPERSGRQGHANDILPINLIRLRYRYL